VSSEQKKRIIRDLDNYRKRRDLMEEITSTTKRSPIFAGADSVSRWLAEESTEKAPRRACLR
jgi:hypothetical protein